MRYSILAFVASVAAVPFVSTGNAALCPTGLYSNPQCCATDVLGLVGLNCAVPATAPDSADDFISGCAATGQQAKCCVLPVAGQDLLCQDVSPDADALDADALDVDAPDVDAPDADAPGGGAPIGGPAPVPVPTGTDGYPYPTPSNDCNCDYK